MQGFRFVYNEYGAPTSRITDILFKDGEVGSAGEAVKLDAGRWTKAGATDEIGGFLSSNIEAGTDQPCEVFQAREGDVFEAAFTGTPDAGFVPGANEVAIAADGLSVDAATITGGSIAVLGVIEDKKICRVKVKKRQLS